MRLEEAKQVLNDNGYILEDNIHNQVWDITNLINSVDRSHAERTAEIGKQRRPLEKQRELLITNRLDLIQNKIKEYFDKTPYKLNYIGELYNKIISLHLSGDFSSEVSFSIKLAVYIQTLKMPEYIHRYYESDHYNKINIYAPNGYYKRIDFKPDKRFTKKTPEVIRNGYKDLMLTVQGLKKLADEIAQDPKIKEIDEKLKELDLELSKLSYPIHPLLMTGC